LWRRSEEEAETVIDVGGGAPSLADELLDLGAKRVVVLEKRDCPCRNAV
jgi:16S rRNA A1518/A1519 N6-dimethyltransferase RsmA/KsgA/DIM1 with predicted DNA glycosylase/AP lyase activity